MIFKSKAEEHTPKLDAKGRKSRMFGLSVVLLALCSIGVSFLVLMGVTPIVPSETVVYIALGFNGALVFLLIGLIIFELVKLLQARRRGRAAARLHVRIVTMFSLVAALPAFIVAVVATITLDQGLDRWFETRTRNIITNAQSVAAAYVQEHGNSLRSTLIGMASDVDLNRNSYFYDPTRFDRFFETQTWVRGLLGAYVLKNDGTVVMRVLRDPKVEPLLPPQVAMNQAKDGAPVLIAPGVSNLVGGVIKLSAFDDLYLYVTRALDPRVVEYQRLAEAGVNEYAELEQRRFGVQLAFALVYVGVALVLLLSSIWVGFGFANQLVLPIRNLIGAADQVSKGNYYVEVEAAKASGDLESLGRTFNNMTGQLRGQRDALLAANDQIDRRRRFSEAVLSGVSSGVIGIDDEGDVTMVNRSATRLLSQDENELLEKPIYDNLPEVQEVVSKALEESSSGSQVAQVAIMRKGRERTVNVRVTTEEATRSEHGFVVTLDDITDLVAAQRNSAWADVARRIAHEIKNPLTPIQLSAERIRRRYGKRIEDDDRKVFDQCVDTIIRQVGDIGRMVDEFSSFARMPKPKMEEADLRSVVRESTFMVSVANSQVHFETDVPDEAVRATFDSRLVGQAVGNVIKNASEAVEAYLASEENPEQGSVLVKLYREGPVLTIDVIDNGIGLPTEHRTRLLEPYMTTREKGTGLGLAIVRKIMEDHGGGIELLDAPSVAEGGHGAMVRLTLRSFDVPSFTENVT
ncbi:Alginate biosynthesis sensor protein KinB [Pseudovibrio sp. W64]|uniref:sensor histidine kinase NtrY-like n=1 Tax=unclassified Pseudovibrio TaxID=2627060 RepID=UPI00070FF011|nr:MULTISPECIES: PAS domain-containing sensor histidine kinase [unclassified Pseudovibrio]KZK80328.1 Alginate biosynthesis sensor protein KinB [Pseudovibrio sp. W64]KZK82559.1 Alginate biosynthesis sensor protein KinB [Pseudovibrio sp. Ad46]KZK98553.1 Alginate biosynthesis sensor protein KinB [Pseudovibrio sp. W74]KZL08399.1 Alginate biosynthesis sensor protein KinB [Pseudovibrio sp. Ad14]KZL19185.1 Alginate biosynthesis sensor protein KinB [Pseudovibrio sp. WM33]